MADVGAAVRLDERDGRPRWNPEPGGPLVPGHLAWGLIMVGPRRETWLCWSVDLWAPAVVKVVRPGWKPVAVRALDQEARALMALRHPAIPRLLHDGRAHDVPFLAVEYMDGPNLFECVEADGRLSAEDTACLGVVLLGAVRALHARSLAHLDVDPLNVLLVDGKPRLVDLGAARPLGHRMQPSERAGTEGFRAPELAAEGVRTVTPAMDVYGVGATLHALLHPQAPRADAVMDVVAELTDPDPDRRPTVDAAMVGLVAFAGEEAARPWPSWADAHLGAHRPLVPG
ncbi:protein kinase [Geodermatophilus sp. SYSU D00703]